MRRSTTPRRIAAIALLLAASAPAAAQTPAATTLLAVRADVRQGSVLVTLPPPAADGVSLRLLYTVALRTGLGSAPTFLDRGRVGVTQIIAFHRLGKKIAIQFENPRFRAAGTDAMDPRGSADFAVSTVWMGDIVATRADGGMTIDLAGFLAADTLGIAASLDQRGDTFGTGDAHGQGKGFTLADKLSVSTPSAAVFTVVRNRY